MKTHFVKSITNLFASISSIWSAIYQALSIMNISILCCAAWTGGKGGVSEIDKDQPTPAGTASRKSTNSYCVVTLFIYYNVMCLSVGQSTEKTSQVTCVGKCDWAGGVDREKLICILLALAFKMVQ